MDMGVFYTGVCRCPIHASWLGDICSRHALRQMCTKGSPLYNERWSRYIKTHFAELLGRLNDQDATGDQDAMESEIAPEKPTDGAGASARLPPECIVGGRSLHRPTHPMAIALLFFCLPLASSLPPLCHTTAAAPAPM